MTLRVVRRQSVRPGAPKRETPTGGNPVGRAELLPEGYIVNDFIPIKATASDWECDEDVRKLNQDDRDAITELLMGRKVAKVDGEHIQLDDGTIIKAIGHDGGCSCSAGCYDLSVLNGVDNIITRVEFDYHPDDNDGWGDKPTAAQTCEHGPSQQYEGHYRIFVYAENQKINLMQFDGSDGNGYYGTGYEILGPRRIGGLGMNAHDPKFDYPEHPLRHEPTDHDPIAIPISASMYDALRHVPGAMYESDASGDYVTIDGTVYVRLVVIA